jgi:DNA-binding GntR family transcriptional regulator
MDASMTTPETLGTRVDSAYDWLLAEITGFRIRSGAPLSENRIAASLGISRTPVREALQRLEKEGLVRRTDNSRFTVSQLTTTEVNDACDLLEALDTYVCRKAASKLDPTTIALLTESVAEMNRAALAGERSSWAAADLSFHRVVNSIAGNQLVTDTVKAARQRIQRFWLRAASQGHRLEACSREHEVLAQAMIAKDYDAIEPAVREHIEHMRGRMLEMLENAAAILGD